MSALRVESVRLCWFEAFVAVADQENISAAANQLGISQPTVSRYIQFLERWSGKQLIEPGRISDAEDPRVSVGITEAGRELYDIAQRAINELAQFRTEAAKRNELIDDMRRMVVCMRKDLGGPSPSKTARRIGSNIEIQARVVDALGERTPLEPLRVLHVALRKFFSTYEQHKKRELSQKRLASAAPLLSE
jgi:DNA-binding MarR family transcriptional regulator